jgi:protein-tyrosine phosphatase
MNDFESFVDIHCHLLPGIDDGATSWDDCLAMARMAAEDGIATIICTPHQNGSYAHNHGDMIRELAAETQEFLDANGVGLRVLPGADVRIEDTMIKKLRQGEVLTLADRGKHVLLELPHELYFPLEPVLDNLEAAGMVGILSHPERNQGIVRAPQLLGPLVDRGCLMQVTCGSLMGTFGPGAQELAEAMLRDGLVHFLATDAHSPKSRRPLMQRAFERTAELVGWDLAVELCCTSPAAVAAGRDVAAGRRGAPRRSWLGRLFGRGAA